MAQVPPLLAEELHPEKHGGEGRVQVMGCSRCHLAHQSELFELEQFVAHP